MVLMSQYWHTFSENDPILSFIDDYVPQTVLISHNEMMPFQIVMFFALAPVATVGYIKSPIRYLSEILPEVEVT